MSKENPDAIQMDEGMTQEEQSQALRTYENDILGGLDHDVIDIGGREIEVLHTP